MKRNKIEPGSNQRLLRRKKCFSRCIRGEMLIKLLTVKQVTLIDNLINLVFFKIFGMGKDNDLTD